MSEELEREIERKKKMLADFENFMKKGLLEMSEEEKEKRENPILEDIYRLKKMRERKKK